MAYLRAVLNGDRVALFMGDANTKRKGRAAWVAEVDNVPGLHALNRPITATTKSTLDWIHKQEHLAEWYEEIKSVVTGVRNCSDEAGSKFELSFESQGQPTKITASYVINATGIMDVQPNIGGSIQPILPFANRYDVLYCIRCDGHKAIGKKLSVIGNTGTAVSMAVVLIERYGLENVSVLSHGLEPKYSEESIELAAAYGIEFQHSSIASVLGDPKANGLEGYKLDDGTIVDTNCTFIALGIIPYNQLLKDIDAELSTDGRAIVSDKYESSVAGFFVVGDLVSGRKAQVYTAWDEAVDAADAINGRIRLDKRELRLQAHRNATAET